MTDPIQTFIELGNQYLQLEKSTQPRDTPLPDLFVRVTKGVVTVEKKGGWLARAKIRLMGRRGEYQLERVAEELNRLDLRQIDIPKDQNQVASFLALCTGVKKAIDSYRSKKKGRPVPQSIEKLDASISFVFNALTSSKGEELQSALAQLGSQLKSRLTQVSQGKEKNPSINDLNDLATQILAFQSQSEVVWKRVVGELTAIQPPPSLSQLVKGPQQAKIKSILLEVGFIPMKTDAMEDFKRCASQLEDCKERFKNNPTDKLRNIQSLLNQIQIDITNLRAQVPQQIQELSLAYDKLKGYLESKIQKLGQFASEKLKEYEDQIVRQKKELDAKKQLRDLSQEDALAQRIKENAEFQDAFLVLVKKIVDEDARCIDTSPFGQGAKSHPKLTEEIADKVMELFSSTMRQIKIAVGSRIFKVKLVGEGRSAQLIARSFLAEGSSKDVYLTSIVAGPIFDQTFGKAFVYVKPKEGVNIDDLQREWSLIQELQEKDPSINIPKLRIVYKVKDPSKVKGAWVQLCDGGDIAQITGMAGAKFPLNGPVYKEKLRYAAEIASGVAKCHRQGVIHGDLKPMNLMFRTDSENVKHVFLTDFGSAGRKEREIELHPTLTYLCPELWGEKKAFPMEAQDLWALGITLFQLFYGDNKTPDELLDLAQVTSLEEQKHRVIAMRDAICKMMKPDHPITLLILNALEVDPNKRWPAEKLSHEFQALFEREQ